jgi:hypothetical protein
VMVRDGEVLTVVSNYSSQRRHTGVMGLFYILVAEHQQQEKRNGGSSSWMRSGLAFMYRNGYLLQFGRNIPA